MNKTLKILSVLLSYPEKDIMEFLPEVIPVLYEEGIMGRDEILKIEGFVEHYKNCDITEWQEQYVHLFDNSRALSLNLFEHVYGDSKDRGQAMVDLGNFYTEWGFDLSGNEMPDYLPAYLEFLSLCDKDKVIELLSDIVKITEKIENRLKEMDSPYHHVFGAIKSFTDIS